MTRFRLPVLSRGTAERLEAIGTAQDRADVVRIVLAALVLPVTGLFVHRDRVGALEVDVFRLLNDLPDWLHVPGWPVMQLGNLIAVPVIAVALVAMRRRALALQVLLAGVGVWLLAKVVKELIVRPRPGALLDGVHLRNSPVTGLGYPSGHAAVVAAVATLVVPHLPRRWRLSAVALVVLVCVARVYVGAHLPLDVVGGAALGWGFASLVRLIGSNVRRSVTTTSAP